MPTPTKSALPPPFLRLGIKLVPSFFFFSLELNQQTPMFYLATNQPIMKHVQCSSCRRSEITNFANFSVSGRLNSLPYRANLCADHLADMERSAGLTVRSCHRIAPPTISAIQLEAVYKRLCATVRLDDSGLEKLSTARNRWLVALIG